MKYNIEGGFDFYGELFSTLDKEEEDENEKCLITGLPLEKDNVTLECNHKFNYGALFKEIYNQKYEYKTYDRLHLKDKMLDKFLNSGKDYFIRCPYCRNIQFEILPFIEGYRKFYGINTLDVTLKKSCDNNKPTYIGSKGIYNHGVLYKYTYPSNCAVEGCKNTYCALNAEFNINYCFRHMGREIRKKINEKKKQQKIEEKHLLHCKKLEEKEKKKQEKIEAKEKQKKEKLEAKSKVKSVNVVMSSLNQISEYVPQTEEQICHCEAILKTGPNKGKVCGMKIMGSSINNLCKRHSKKTDKKEENDI